MDDDRFFKVVVPPHQSRERLDKFLARFVASVSRARLQKAIAGGHVQVDGRTVKASHLVSPKEEIAICLPKATPVDILAEDIPLDILYEDGDLLVVNKVAGMVVHPAFSNFTGTLVNALMHHCGNLSSVGGRQRPGIVHRLDKNTSGILVVAKNDVAHHSLSAQFRAKTTRRIYWAICWHSPRKSVGRIETYIARSPKDRRRMTVQQSGKLAATHYTVLESFHNHSLLELQLETGRTHQIRVHMAHLGHPILGDGEYGGRNRQFGTLSKPDFESAAAILAMMPRQALHAKSLGFQHPTKNEWMSFDSALPEDMQTVLDRLRTEAK